MATDEKNHNELEDNPDYPIILTDDTIDEALKKYPFIVVDFWAQWCGPCKMLGPIIQKLAKEKVGDIVFGKMDVDTNPKSSVSYGIRSIPNLIIFKNGQRAGDIIGALPEAQLLKKISEYK
jgi:thioredoxin 1